MHTYNISTAYNSIALSHRGCKSLPVNPSSHYHLGKMNGPMNPFSFVLLTVSLIIFGLFIPCFTLQKASALHTRMHARTSAAWPLKFSVSSAAVHLHTVFSLRVSPALCCDHI